MGSSDRQSGTSEPVSPKEILCDVNGAGGFEAVVLAYTNGLPIATVPADYDGEVAAAVVALLQRVSGEVQSQLGMAEVDEVTIRTKDRVRLVCRHLAVEDEEYILVAVVSPGRYYRRVTNQAIKQIVHLLS
jgi:predicted regulator of Ras-like GTPase activity (Roadblock/LC7/MglB family)